MQELDQQLPPVQQPLVKLLRTDDKTARARMLREKMASKGKFTLAGMDGKEQDDDDGEPEVPLRELSQALLELKQRFGNVDENYDTGFVKKLEMVGDEAEAIALELAGGKEVSAQEQQDMMWDRGTVSVFELEKVEDQAHEEGSPRCGRRRRRPDREGHGRAPPPSRATSTRGRCCEFEV